MPPNGSNDFLAAEWEQRLPRRRMGATTSSPPNGSNDFLAAEWEQRLPRRRMGATTSLSPNRSNVFLAAEREQRLPRRRTGATTSSPPNGSNVFLAAGWEQRLPCRRMGAAAFLPPIRGAGGTESPLYTFPPLHFPPTESPNNTKEQATRISPSRWKRMRCLTLRHRPGGCRDRVNVTFSRSRERFIRQHAARRPGCPGPDPPRERTIAPEFAPEFHGSAPNAVRPHGVVSPTGRRRPPVVASIRNNRVIRSIPGSSPRTSARIPPSPEPDHMLRRANRAASANSLNFSGASAFYRVWTRNRRGIVCRTLPGFKGSRRMKYLRRFWPSWLVLWQLVMPIAIVALYVNMKRLRADTWEAGAADRGPTPDALP